MTPIKKKATNFSYKEEKPLLALVKKYASTIECKRTDINSNKLKAAFYEKLAIEFNSVCDECYRSPKILRSKYENIKKCGKKVFSNERAYLHGTCGGPARTTSSSKIQSELQEILGNQVTDSILVQLFPFRV
ncbi:myb/SANT-like DNA-binding domain-containing protein 3 [Acyrthosiphon pisum]|uniref:Regulatory protein zeste n=1 Tax=Acyrthosiphon pisum TaxID=7029 RepID=A0A8R2FAT7_ACYPI|nr:myb/SANT-like DNA-binding domain-containing protein 3 [Acyrthosiphon pisum]|eukprot:XP_008184168.1 PREDICTED: myb/SANT-like DNA-binding domain-containing protein 3 [Acyrthosiphon pisum]